jgi:hypothetical protein
MNLKQKKIFYFFLTYFSLGMAGYQLGLLADDGFKSDHLSAVIAIIISFIATAIGSFMQWRYIFNLLKKQDK